MRFAKYHRVETAFCLKLMFYLKYNSRRLGALAVPRAFSVMFTCPKPLIY